MIRTPITYVDYDGIQRTEPFYFNLTKKEVLDLRMDEKAERIKEINARIEKIDDMTDSEKITLMQDFITFFEDIAAAAYGIRSEDGRRFIKSSQVLEEFKQTAVYSDFLFFYAEHPDQIAPFIDQIVPASMITEVQQARENGVPTTEFMDSSQAARARSEANLQGYKQPLHAQPESPRVYDPQEGTFSAPQPVTSRETLVEPGTAVEEDPDFLEWKRRKAAGEI